MTKELPVRQYRGDERLLDAAVWDEELGAYEWDLETDSVRWLNDWCRHYDIDPCVGSAHGVRWRERVHPEDRVRARLRKCSITPIRQLQPAGRSHAVSRRSAGSTAA